MNGDYSDSISSDDYGVIKPIDVNTDCGDKKLERGDVVDTKGNVITVKFQ